MEPSHELCDFAESIMEMKWRDMERLSTQLAGAVRGFEADGERIDGQYIAGLLVSLAEEIEEERDKSCAD